MHMCTLYSIYSRVLIFAPNKFNVKSAKINVARKMSSFTVVDVLVITNMRNIYITIHCLHPWFDLIFLITMFVQARIWLDGQSLICLSAGNARLISAISPDMILIDVRDWRWYISIFFTPIDTNFVQLYCTGVKMLT